MLCSPQCLRGLTIQPSKEGEAVSTKEAIRYERARPPTAARRARRTHSPALEAATAPRRQAGGLAAPGGLSLAWVCVAWRGENDPPHGEMAISIAWQQLSRSQSQLLSSNF